MDSCQYIHAIECIDSSMSCRHMTRQPPEPLASRYSQMRVSVSLLDIYMDHILSHSLDECMCVCEREIKKEVEQMREIMSSRL